MPSCERPGWRSSSEKSGFLLRAGVPVTTRYAFIHREEGSYPITMMCRCLKVSRSGYYAWLGREPSRTVRRRKELSALIEWVFNSSHGTYAWAVIGIHGGFHLANNLLGYYLGIFEGPATWVVSGLLWATVGAVILVIGARTGRLRLGS